MEDEDEGFWGRLRGQDEDMDKNTEDGDDDKNECEGHGGFGGEIFGNQDEEFVFSRKLKENTR